MSKLSLLTLLLYTLHLNQVAAIDFNNNGYTDLVISIHPDVPGEQSNQMIENIQVHSKSIILKLL